MAMCSCASRWPSRAAALAGALLFAGTCAHAAAIYRWVDENGRTHVADVVPEKYRATATRIDSGQYEVSPAQRKEAEARAARDKALAASQAAARRSPAASAPAAKASTPTSARRPAQGVTEATDCDTWRRLYRESEDCFAPYRSTRGGIKPEAFEACNPIPSPELKCGPLRQ
jgi:Domain of unknown function (DUF4124)